MPAPLHRDQLAVANDDDHLLGADLLEAGARRPRIGRFAGPRCGDEIGMEAAANPRPLAVVTGASSGIGRELAKQFAENGFDLIVAAEDEDIHAAAQELEGLGARAEAVQVDLARPEGVEALHERIRAAASSVDAIALNAGIGMGGEFATGTDLAQELQIVDLNCRSTVHLAKLVVRDMVAAGSGRMLLTSSIASTMPGSFQAVYNASKSFVQSFALALRDELRDTGVTVTSLMPGPTDTEFFERADMLDTRVGASDSKDDPADVAREGFEALMAGEERVVSASLATKLQGRVGRFVPDSVKAKMHGRMAEPGSGKE
jgi:short-subunit dehydrogenase